MVASAWTMPEISGEQRGVVEGMLRRRDLVPRVRERLEMVKAAGLGRDLPEIVRWSGRSPRTIRFWLDRFVAAGAEGPRGLQPFGVGALGPRPAAPTPRRVLPRLDDHRPHRWQLDHLAASDPSLPGQRQRLATAPARARPAPHDHVRRLPSPTDAVVSPTALPRPTLRPIRLEPARRRHRRVPRRLRRLPQSGQLGLQLGEPLRLQRDLPLQSLNQLPLALDDLLLLADHHLQQLLAPQPSQRFPIHQDRQLTRTLSCVRKQRPSPFRRSIHRSADSTASPAPSGYRGSARVRALRTSSAGPAAAGLRDIPSGTL